MYGILLAGAILVIIVLIIGIHQKNTNAVCLSRRRLQGKTVLVTGGTAGMGLEIAADLAHRGARVIIACPFEEEGNSAKQHIIQETGNNNVVFKLLDLASLASVRAFAANILNTEDRLDILINNAGVGVPCDHITPDGMHFIMQVNYYGTFLLTILLIPLLKKTGTVEEPSRIVVTSSVLHQFGRIDFKTINNTDPWLMLQIYSNSKLCLVLFANELAKRLRNSECNVVINSVDPGAVGTGIYDSGNKFIGAILKFLFKFFFKTPWEGAQTALHVVLDKEAGKKTGCFYKNCQINKAINSAYCEKTAKKLWEESLRLVKLSDNEII